MPDYCNGSWVEIDTAQVRANARAIRDALPASTDVIAVVKSDAYGHSLAPFAAALREGGVRSFAVAYPAEAATVRAAVPDARLIVVLGAVWPDDVPALLENRVTPVVVSLSQAQALSDAALALHARLPVHVKLDTGMGRLGFIVPRDLPDALAAAALPGLDPQGVCTHFAIVEPQRIPAAAPSQVARFKHAADALDAALSRRLFRHISSSRASLLMPECDCNAIRAGIVLYGYGAANPHGRYVTRPVLQWKSRVMQVKSVPAGFPTGYYGAYVTEEPTDLAVVSCGYTDGYLRLLGNTGHVLVGGKRRPVVGRVSMNWITIDLGANSGVRPGDEVVLLGTQGAESVWADELAHHCHTIPYEILTDISRQIERRYL